MEAARVCRLRGHDVTLFEERELGGLLHEASVPEFKADIRPLMKYQICQIEKLGIPVVKKRAQAEDLKDFDAVICATGSAPAELHVPGAEQAHVMNALEVLNGSKKAEGTVAVIGGGLIGTETAIWLAEQGHGVSLVEMLPEIMNGVAATDCMAYQERIAGAGMAVYTDARLEKIGEKEITVKMRKGERSIPADTVVIAVGLKARQSLYEELLADGKKAYLIGDAVKPGKIFDAFHTAYKLAVKI